MKLRILFIALMATCCVVRAQTYSWKTDAIDGHITDCTATRADNVPQALGHIDQQKGYTAPSGKVYPMSSATAKVAGIVIDAQPKIAHLKQVVAYSAEEMTLLKAECPLVNWFVDIVGQKVEELSGQKIDVTICNLGGGRTSMPKGDVLLDDIQSMFPFRNYLVHLRMKGSSLRGVFEAMAKRRFEALGGVTIEVTGGEITSIMVGDQPLDDEKIYNVATISFLLNGGDHLFLADASLEVNNLDKLIFDAVMEHVNALTAEGKPIAGTDVRHVIIK